jgi:hypothetical protein
VSIGAALVDARDQIRAAGLRCVVDPADAHPPVVLLVPVEADRLAERGSWQVTVEARMIATPATPLWAWGPDLDTLAELVGADSIDAGTDDDGSPFVGVRFVMQATADPPAPTSTPHPAPLNLDGFTPLPDYS